MKDQDHSTLRLGGWRRCKKRPKISILGRDPNCEIVKVEKPRGKNNAGPAFKTSDSQGEQKDLDL